MADITLDLVASKDAHTYIAGGSTNYGSSEYLQIETHGGGPYTKYVYLGWDLSEIPEGSIIKSGTMYWYFSSKAGGTMPTLYTYRCDADWAENTITWNNQPGITGDSIYSWTGLTTTGVWRNSGNVFTSTLQGWLDGTINNYGIRVYPISSDPSAYVIFHSKENATNKPYMKIVYEPPANPGFFAFFCESWQRRGKLWRNNKLVLPKDLGFSY